MECRSFIQAVLSKLQEESPLKYTFAQKLSCLNPKGMATESSEGNITTFRAFVRHLNEANCVAERDADSVISQYKTFLEEPVPENKSKFLDRSHMVDRTISCMVC